MTSREEVADVKLNRDEKDGVARGLGHELTWRLGPNARRKGWAYHWIGDCVHCAATVSVGWGWSSCGGIRDARHVPCSGPGTAILTEIEAARSRELVAEAIAQFGREVAENQRRADGEDVL
uniref:hypothetical protein n=1 Tax=Nonomuraea sp. CA-251285 TaxID=3240002 RepID=UPI003F49500E